MSSQLALTSAEDKEKLMQAIDAGLDDCGTYASSLDRFRREIRQSRAVPPWDVPGDMITMNSRFMLRSRDAGESNCYSLVYPEREAFHEGRISVLSPMGMALHAAREGDWVTWLSPIGPGSACVERVLYQPERQLKRLA